MITGVNDCGQPNFYKIKENYVKDGSSIFGVESQEIIQHSSHYHAWVVMDSSEKHIITLDSLYTRQCLYSRSLSSAPSNYTFLTLKFSF